MGITEKRGIDGWEEWLKEFLKFDKSLSQIERSDLFETYTGKMFYGIEKTQRLIKKENIRRVNQVEKEIWRPLE